MADPSIPTDASTPPREPPVAVVPGPLPNLPSWLTFWWFGRVLDRVSGWRERVRVL